jgi:uncharacterized protein YecA (UPF0149 family)
LSRVAISADSLKNFIREIDIELFEADESNDEFRLFNLHAEKLKAPTTEAEEAFSRLTQIRFGQYVWRMVLPAAPKVSVRTKKNGCWQRNPCARTAKIWNSWFPKPPIK